MTLVMVLGPGGNKNTFNVDDVGYINCCNRIRRWNNITYWCISRKQNKDLVLKYTGSPMEQNGLSQADWENFFFGRDIEDTGGQ